MGEIEVVDNGVEIANAELVSEATVETVEEKPALTEEQQKALDRYNNILLDVCWMLYLTKTNDPHLEVKKLVRLFADDVLSFYRNNEENLKAQYDKIVADWGQPATNDGDTV